MQDQVTISVCIPAYKHTGFLRRLLDSLQVQTFRDFEVIVTDDSPDNSVKELCLQYLDKLPLQYFRNEKALGTPENWNEAIRHASGKWIKLVHDDDWLADKKALQHFADAIGRYPSASFFFCAYRNIDLNSGKEEVVRISSFRYRALRKQPAVLFSSNAIGPPSVIMHLNDGRFFYDRQIKWVVDIDFYIRYFTTTRPVYIDEPLMNVGLGEYQVTQDCFRRREVELPENFYLLSKTGTGVLRNVLVYDAWWRLMRNLEVRHEHEIGAAGYKGPVHPVLLSMIRWQRMVPKWLLARGIFSKLAMFLHYLLNLPWMHD